MNKAAANGGTLNRQTLFAALKDEHSFNADGIVGPTDVGNRAPSTCEVLVQLQNGVWNRVDPVTPGTFDCNAANIATHQVRPSRSGTGMRATTNKEPPDGVSRST